MSEPRLQTITKLLQDARVGDRDAGGSLLAAAYEELGRLARAHFSAQRSDHTLQPTALVHEAWLKLVGHLGRIEDRPHFFAIASRAMRQVLADHARGRNRAKRKGDHARITLDHANVAGGDDGIEFVDLDDSLRRLAALNERHARIVELRFFGGLTIAETAAVLEVSHDTVEAGWFMARAWLHDELGQAG